MKYVAPATRFVLVSIPTWLLISVIRLPLYLIGFAVVWFASRTTVERLSPYYKGRSLLEFAHPLAWLWGNYEDGVDGLRGGDAAQAWWAMRTRQDSVRVRIWKWSALRNPVNNMRYLPVLCPLFRPASIGAIGSPTWGYVWMGAYTRLWIQTPHVWFSIGWKITAQDALGVPSTDTRLPRADFGLQLQRVQ